MRTLVTFLWLGAAVAVAAAGPQFPPTPRPAVLPVTPTPGAAVRLGASQYYVIRSDVPLVVEQLSGPGAVALFERDGSKRPLTLPAAWVVGWPPDADDAEFVTFADRYLYVAKAKTAGAVVLQTVPALNLTDSKGKQTPLTRADIIRKTLDVDTGTGPQPPPPVPPVPPVPPTPPKPPTTFQVVVVFESGATLTAAQAAVVYGRAVEEFLTARCTGGKAGWGRRDKDADPAVDTTPLKPMWADVKPKLATATVPLLAIAVDKAVTLEPLPATPAAAVALLTKYAEGR